MFRRHCALAHWLAEHPTTAEWVLFLDADMAVINPNHLIEDFLPAEKGIDLVSKQQYRGGLNVVGAL